MVMGAAVAWLAGPGAASVLLLGGKAVLRAVVDVLKFCLLTHSFI